MSRFFARHKEPEDLITEYVACVIQPASEDPLLALLGSIQTDAADVARRHDEFLGQALQAEMTP